MARTLIIGPSQAGKTVMLASLRQAALNPEKGTWKVSVEPRSDSMKDLLFNASKIVLEGHMKVEASDKTNNYDFDLKVRKGFLGRLVAKDDYRSDSFVLLDGPGGVIFGDANEGDGRLGTAERISFRELLVRTARDADGLIICVDASEDSEKQARGQDSVSLMFRYMPRFFDDMGEAPFKRLAICLNKADKYFAAKNHLAAREVRSRNELDRAFNKSITKPNQNFLDSKLPASSVIAYGWTSAFGFLSTGAPNLEFDPDEPNALSYLAGRDGKSGELGENWRPFQVLDPFLFMMEGTLGGFVPLQRSK